MEDEEPRSEFRLESFACAIITVTLVSGAVFCGFLVCALAYGCIVDGQVPHLFNPVIAVQFMDNSSPVAVASSNAYFLKLGGWTVRLITAERVSTGAVAIQLGWLLLQPGLALSILWLIRKILKSIEAGEPFHDSAPGRVEAIGLLIMAGTLGRTAHGLLTGIYFRNHYALSKGSFALSLDYNGLCSGIGIGLVILVLAHVFRQGRALRREQELTI